MEAGKRGIRKRRQGVVVGKSGNKTIVVRVEIRRRHPKYGKVVRQFKKFHTHDENDAAAVGDRVEIVETRPMSRLKRWRLIRIAESAGQGAAQKTSAQAE